MARAEVPDTSVLIHAIRHPDAWSTFQAALATGRVWLSSVAIAELYAGTRSRGDARVVDRIVHAVSRRDRLLVPNADVWVRAGRLIARRIRLYGALEPRDHLADVLIVLSAAQLRGTVVTANVRHLRMWAELANTSGLDVLVTPYRP